jgi:hypothetical protein
VKQLKNVINKRAKEEVLIITVGMELEVVTTSIVEKRRDSTMMEGKRWMLMTTTSGETSTKSSTLINKANKKVPRPFDFTKSASDLRF